MLLQPIPAVLIYCRNTIHSMCGGNKCDVASATFAIHKILRTNICHSSLESNVLIKIDKETTANLLKESASQQLPQSVKTLNVLNRLEKPMLAILDELTVGT